MNSDFKDLLRCLNAEKVKYLIVGGYAVSYYTEPRYTKDLDIWVGASTANSKNLIKALTKFGAPTDNLTTQDFAQADTLFVFGIPPNRVDILTSISGVDFSEAWKQKNIVKIDQIPISFISCEHLILAKHSAGRPQDKIDLRKLKKKF